MSEKQAFTVDLLDNDQYQSLLKKDGKLQTSGMHSGRVYLTPGKQCGQHSTENKEELLVFLSGHGQAEIQNQPVIDIAKGKILYIPPQTSHNIINTSTSEPLVYIFCTAPAK